MPELHVGLGTASTFFLVLMRTAALVSVAPPFSEAQVPKRIRLALAMVISAVLCMGLPPSTLLAEPTLSVILSGALRETLLGIAGGLGMKLVFEASSAAGYMAGTSMGLGFGSLAGMGSDTQAVSQLVRLLTLGAILGLGIHRDAIAWLYGSLRSFPPGGSIHLLQLASACVGYAIYSIALAVRVIFPVLAASLLGHLVLGIVSRSAPQINIQSVGFSESIIAGQTALYFAAPLVAASVGAATVASILP